MISCTLNAGRILKELDPLLAIESAPKYLLRALADHTGMTFPQGGPTLRNEQQEKLQYRLVEGQTIELKPHPIADGGFVIAFEDVSLRRAAEANTAALARMDILTKLPNRLMLRERLDEALARLQRGVKDAHCF